jgi:hypothetical protein
MAAPTVVSCARLGEWSLKTSIVSETKPASNTQPPNGNGGLIGQSANVRNGWKADIVAPIQILMRSWSEWYRILFLVWLVLCPASIVIGYGFSGGDLEVPTDPVGLTLWFLCVAFYISPIVLWPIRRRGHSEDS